MQITHSIGVMAMDLVKFKNYFKSHNCFAKITKLPKNVRFQIKKALRFSKLLEIFCSWIFTLTLYQSNLHRVTTFMRKVHLSLRCLYLKEDAVMFA